MRSLGRVEGLPRTRSTSASSTRSRTCTPCPTRRSSKRLWPHLPRESAHVADRAQRRYLQLPLGRSGVRPRVHPAHAGAGQAGRLLHGAGRLLLGPRVPEHRARDAAPTGHEEAVVQLHALGAAELRSEPARRACSSGRWRRGSRRSRRISCLHGLVDGLEDHSRRSRASSGATSTSAGSPRPACSHPTTGASTRSATSSKARPCRAAAS